MYTEQDKQGCTDGLMDMATVHCSVHSKLSGGNGVDLPIVMDSGCSKYIISEAIVRALGLRVTLSLSFSLFLFLSPLGHFPLPE